MKDHKDSNVVIPPVELSAKYMAWNIKRIDEHLSKIAKSLEETVELLKGNFKVPF